jgi:hypothetical protein
MKCLAAVAVMIAGLSVGALAQRGGSHGGFSGSRGGYSGSHMGFSGARPGFSVPVGGFHSPPALHNGFSAPRSGLRTVAPRTLAPTRFAPRSPSYPIRGMRPVTTGPRMSYGTLTHRVPYHSSYDGNHYHHGHHYYPHNLAVVVNSFWPFWYSGYPYAYGYPYIWPSIFNDSNNYDQPASNYATPQPYDYNNVPYQMQPYQPQPEDQQEPHPLPDPFPQQPNPSHLGPYNGAPSPPSSAPPVTLIFKDGRPPEQIYNYLLTPNTLSVLDQNRRDIPVSQIDVDATAKANLQAGVNFSLPVR